MATTAQVNGYANTNNANLTTPLNTANSTATPSSANTREYFYLSDLAKPVQLKIKSVEGNLRELAERAVFDQTQHDIPLDIELEMYVSVSIWSRGNPIGLPANTSYRAAMTSPSTTTSGATSGGQTGGAGGIGGGSSQNNLANSESSDSSNSSSSLASSLDFQISSSPPPHSSSSPPSQPTSAHASVKWNSWLSFPVQYRDLDHASRFGITVWCVAHGTGIQADHTSTGGADGATQQSGSNLVVHSRLFSVGGCSVPIFNKRGLLKLGRRKLSLISGSGENDTSASSTSSAPRSGAPSTTSSSSGTNVHTQHQVGLDKLNRLCREFDMKMDYSSPIVWLDKLATRRITTMQRSQYAYDAEGISPAASHSPISLVIEFPAFKHPIVYHQKTYMSQLTQIRSENDVKERLFVLHDPEIFKVNPIEHCYHKMARSNKGLDRDLKPNKKEREEISAILSSPNKRMSSENKELLWKFRFSLTDDPRAVTKFLRCVTWSDVNESKQALDLLNEWVPIEPADALELLSSAFAHEGVRAYAVKQLASADQEEVSMYLLQLVQALRYEHSVPSQLSEFLIDRASQSLTLANFFHWYLNVEVSDVKRGTMYAQVLKSFLEELAKRGMQSILDILEQQSRLIQQLINLSEHANRDKPKIDRRIERMRAVLQPDGEFKALRQFQQSIRVSVRPEIQVTGIIGEDCTMFKSALAPMLICFSTPPPTEKGEKPSKYRIIFKSGDDLRQDQLVIQMINLMDTLLKKVKLDLQLTPYRVLATGPAHGFVEFVPNSHTVASILAKYEKPNPIRKFFEQYNPKPQTLAKVLDTFVKSCAGYNVITYILGIGDRHLDNVMLTTDGHLFHIDFSFMFGRDPKPFPPPMKFSKEMVEAMGGADSAQYQEFRRSCCLAFNILRQHANLILNLLSLMGDANIPDLSTDVEKNLLKVQEKFRLDISDGAADGYILALIDQSVSALFSTVADIAHKWAGYFK